MDQHRRIHSTFISIQPFLQPFSSFDWVERTCDGSPAIHRCFSLARSFDCQSFIVESIPPVGLIADENQEICNLGIPFSNGELLRVSFWRQTVGLLDNFLPQDPESLIGFAILKQDIVDAGGTPNKQWHVFDAVFRKYEHRHNCVPSEIKYTIRVGETTYRIPGIMYCQQNELNKACAQVALRSLLSRLVPEGDISYSAMNDIARCHGVSDFDPSNGLNVMQIRGILRHYQINFRDVDYREAALADSEVRQTQPYQKYLYSGIESGCGALLGFSMSGPDAKDENHIIPFYGHTFNKDTWVPDAEASYFDIGGGLGYIPSESWTSSFIGHDDNFGANFCIPRLYIRPDQAQYVVEILKTGATYGGMLAEAQASQLLYSICGRLQPQSSWQQRLFQHAIKQKVVLRAVCVDNEVYLRHMQAMQDWNGNKEDPALIGVLDSYLPKKLWVVEISLPHLFPANERKIGEIILDAGILPDQNETTGYGVFVLARFPEQFVVLNGFEADNPCFEAVPSKIQSHVDVLRHEEASEYSIPATI